MGASRAAPNPAGPAATMRRTPCRRAGGNPDPKAHRRRAARGRRAIRIRGKGKAGTRTTAIRRPLAGLAGRVRAGLGIALTRVAKVRARAKAAEEGAKAQRLGSVSRLDMPSPRRRSSGSTRGSKMTGQPKGSAPRSRTSKNAEGVVAAATGPAQPTKEPEGRAQGRPSSPLRPGPAARPNGSSELPGMAENDALFPGPGTRVFPGRNESLVHKSERICGLLALGRGEQDARGPTAHDRQARPPVPRVARKSGGRWLSGSLDGWEGANTCQREPPSPPMVGSAARGHATQGEVSPASLLTGLRGATGGELGYTEPPHGAALGGLSPRGVSAQRPRTETEGTRAGPRKGGSSLPGWRYMLHGVHAPATTNLRVLHRVGDASNPGPTMILPPWQPDPDYTSNFAVFGEGWVVAFVYLGPIVTCGPRLSFQVKAPRGSRLATFFIGHRWGRQFLLGPPRKPSLCLCGSQTDSAPTGRSPRFPRGPPGVCHGGG